MHSWYDLIAAAGIGLFLWRLSAFAKRREAPATYSESDLKPMREIPIVRIADLQPGMVARIVGKAKPFDDVLVAPFTQRPCVCYEARVEAQEAVKDSRYMNSLWGKLVGEEPGISFIVEDASGSIVIDPRNARLLIDVDSMGWSGTLRKANPRQRAFLDKFSLSSEDRLWNPSLRYIESIIEVDELVAVSGLIASSDSAQGLTFTGEFLVTDSPTVTA